MSQATGVGKAPKIEVFVDPDDLIDWDYRIEQLPLPVREGRIMVELVPFEAEEHTG